MKFDYVYKLTPMQTLDIPDVGNCALLLKDDFACKHILIVSTVLGETYYYFEGPVDETPLPHQSTIVAEHFEYSLGQIAKRIKNALKIAESAEIITVEEAIKLSGSLIEKYIIRN